MERWSPACVPATLVGGVPSSGRFSRLIGALGGAAIHARLAALRVVAVGDAQAVRCFAQAVARCGAAVSATPTTTDAIVSVARGDLVVLAAESGAGTRELAAAAGLARVVIAFGADDQVRLVLPGEGDAAEIWRAHHALPTSTARAHFCASYALFLLERLIAGDVEAGRAVRLALAGGAGVVGEPLRLRP
jgi:hypothetical protein